MCKMACWMDLKCVAASVSETNVGDGTMECRLAMEGPTNTTLTDQPDSTYIFWKGWLQFITFPVSLMLKKHKL